MFLLQTQVILFFLWERSRQRSVALYTAQVTMWISLGQGLLPWRFCGSLGISHDYSRNHPSIFTVVDVWKCMRKNIIGWGSFIGTVGLLRVTWESQFHGVSTYFMGFGVRQATVMGLDVLEPICSPFWSRCLWSRWWHDEGGEEIFRCFDEEMNKHITIDVGMSFCFYEREERVEVGRSGVGSKHGTELERGGWGFGSGGRGWVLECLWDRWRDLKIKTALFRVSWPMDVKETSRYN